MTESEFKKRKLDGEIKEIQPDSQVKELPTPPIEIDPQTYLSVLEMLRQPRRYLDTAPTFIPRNFAEQIQFYENGSTYRVYFYVNQTWRYVALT